MNAHIPPSPAGGRAGMVGGRSQGITGALRSDFVDALGSRLLPAPGLNPEPPSVEHLGGVLTPGEVDLPPPRNAGNPLRSITATTQPGAAARARAAAAVQVGAAAGLAENFQYGNEEN